MNLLDRTIELLAETSVKKGKIAKECDVSTEFLVQLPKRNHDPSVGRVQRIHDFLVKAKRLGL